MAEKKFTDKLNKWNNVLELTALEGFLWQKINSFNKKCLPYSITNKYSKEMPGAVQSNHGIIYEKNNAFY